MKSLRLFKFMSALFLLFALTAYLPSYSICKAGFQHSLSVVSQTGATVVFTNSSINTALNSYTKVSWDFGDGYTSNLSNPVHIYKKAGTYLVCITIGDSSSTCYDSYCDTVTVSSLLQGSSCNAQFNFLDTVYLGSSLAVLFTNSTISLNNTTTFSWDFGDGVTSGLQNPLHIYQNAGVYTVCLIISDSVHNCADTICKSINVGNLLPCNANFSSQNTIQNGTYVSSDFANTSAYSSSQAQFSWDFGDNTNSTSKNPVHIYTTAGSYAVCLTLTDSANACIDTYCDTIVIPQNTVSCNALFNYVADSLNTNTYAFTNLSSGLNLNAQWDFGDSTFSNSFNAAHTFPAAGTYSVCLTIGDSTCSDTYCSIVTIVDTSSFSLSGTIWADINVVSHANVQLIAVDTTNANYTVIATVSTDSSGYYVFKNVKKGKYVIKAKATKYSNYLNYCATYYGNVLFWKLAKEINVASNSTSIDISLIAGVKLKGNGSIKGVIWATSNKTDEYLADVDVLLLNPLESPLSYTSSNTNGEFEYNELAMGSYQVYAEIPGKTTQPTEIILTQDNPQEDHLVIEVDQNSIASGVSSLTNNQTFMTMYPNPVSSILYISLSSIKNQAFEIQILNTNGQVVFTQQYAADQAKNISLELSDLPVGIYSLIVKNEMEYNSKIFVKL